MMNIKEIENKIIINEKVRIYINRVIKKPINFVKERRLSSIDSRKFQSDLKLYRSLNRRPEFEATDQSLYPILSEYRGSAGYPGSYFWQDFWGGEGYMRIIRQSILT